MAPRDPAPDFGNLRAQLSPFSFEGDGATPDAVREYVRFYQLQFGDELRVDHRIGTLDTGEVQLAVQSWLPEEPKGTVMVVHGYFDHLGIYRHPIGYFLRRGYAVIGYDQPGHGLSGGDQARIDSFSEYVFALQRVIDLAFDACPRPWHLLAQSMGGAVAMTFLLTREFSREDCPFGEMVLLAPLVYPRGWRWGRWAHLLLRGFVETRPRTFAQNSHDNAFLDFMKFRDPLQSHVLPMQWISALRAWLRDFAALPPSSLAPVVIQGTDDDTVDWERNMGIVVDKFPLATIHYLNGARHHMVNESSDYRARIFELLDERF